MIFPKMVCRNHRYRGPVESFKDSQYHIGLENALGELKDALLANENSMKEIKNLLNNRTPDNVKLSSIIIDSNEIRGEIYD